MTDQPTTELLTFWEPESDENFKLKWNAWHSEKQSQSNEKQKRISGLQLHTIDDSSSSQPNQNSLQNPLQNHQNGCKLDLVDGGGGDDYPQGLQHFQPPHFDHFHGILASAAGGVGAGGVVGGQEESFTCPQCYRTYRRHGTLRRHLRQECGKGKSMVCSVCGHRTKRADHLRQHVRKKHPEIAMRSLFKRQQRAAAARGDGAGAGTAEEGPATEPEIVDLVDMMDEAGAEDEEHHHNAFLVDDDDEEEQQHQQHHLMEASYRQQLRQQALLQQALVAAVVASGSSCSSAELLKGEGL